MGLPTRSSADASEEVIHLQAGAWLSYADGRGEVEPPHIAQQVLLRR